MKIQARLKIKDGATIIPATIDGQPTIVDLPDDKARQAINQHKAFLAPKGAKPNWPVVKQSAKAVKAE